MLYRVLLALDEPPIRVRIRHALQRTGAVVHAIATRTRLWSRLSRENSDLIVIGSEVFPERWRDALRQVQAAPDSPDVLVLAQQDDAAQRAQWFAAGVTAVLQRDLPHAVLTEILGKLHMERLRRTTENLRRRSLIGEPRLGDFISASPAMQSFMDVVERTVENDATLLITGETGVGKERLARAIHAESRRSNGPFIAVNCAALPDQLLESELFGHTAGAFTGATQARRGWFEMAHGGTLFLDEIADLPIQLQAKLLRAVQDHEFQPLGSERSVRVDVRIVAASSDDLAENVELGTFRRDLFYRLSVVTLCVPPLRDRAEDIAELIEPLLEFFRSRIASPVTGVERRAVEALRRYAWPGNVRELRNVIERAMLLSDGPLIRLTDLPDSIVALMDVAPAGSVTPTDGAAVVETPSDWLQRSWRDVREEMLERTERVYLDALLRAHFGRIAATASAAEMTSRSLYEKMRRHGLSKETYRAS